MSADAEFAAFLRDQVRSVWGVELLLLMMKAPERCWTPPELVRELRASTGLVVDLLQRFERSGLIVLTDESGYRYGPASEILAQLSRRLETVYQEKPVWVLNLITQPRDPVQSLADAFRFNKGNGK